MFSMSFLYEEADAILYIYDKSSKFFIDSYVVVWKTST